MKRMTVILLAVLSIGSLSWSRGQAEATGVKNILRIGTPNEVKSANIFADYYLGLFAHISNPPLMKMNQTGDLVGSTAERYQVSEDNRIWTFTIRDDLCWSDGKPLTPEDVRFSIVYTGEKNPSARWIRDTLVEARVSGEHDVVLKFNKPYTGLDLEFATYNIFPEHAWKDVENPMEYSNAGTNVGFGPFFIEKIDLDAGLVRFSMNPFWKGKQPNIDCFEVHIYKSMDVLSIALERGDVDTFFKYASSYPYACISRLKQNGRFDFNEHLNMGLVFLGFNLKREPLQDHRFREALSYAINYREILKLDALGYGQIPSRGFVPPSMGGFKKTDPLVYDPQKAREILSEAGYRDTNGNGVLEDRKGVDLVLSLLVRAEWSRVAELMKDYLATIGLGCDIRSLDLNTWVAEKDKYNYDMTITRTTPWGMLMHAGWGTGYFDSRRTGQGVLHILDDPVFLDLSDRILATTDQQRLAALAVQVQDYYARELPAVALYWNTIVTPFNKVFRGWMPDPLYGIYNLDTLINLEKISP